MNNLILTQVQPVKAVPALDEKSTISILRYGGKEAAIILSIAVLILALAQLIKVLVPVMTKK
jgi:hypothetical protein